MPNHAQRTAIARLLSDLIKSDSIIDQSEIRLYNQLQEEFSITQEERIEALSITMAQAMDQLRLLDEDSKRRLQQALLRTANADNQCVAKEALILLTLNYVLQDTDGKYEVLSCNTHGSMIEDKFVVYIESEQMPEINDEIEFEYEAICDKLALWNFDFVYIPRIALKLQSLPEDYVQDIIRYMNPRFSQDQVENIYQQLTTINTQNFTTQLLGAKMTMPSLITTQPSLLINFGMSQVGEQGVHTEFLRIRLDDTLLYEAARFIRDYAAIITEKETVRPAAQEEYFRYFGFYKALFDFITQAKDGKEIARNIEIDFRRSDLILEGQRIHLSPSQMATYALILHLTSTRDGLPHLRKNQLRSIATTRLEKMNSSISQAYNRIYPCFSHTSPGQQIWNFLNNIQNIAINISHIREKIKKAGLRNPELYIPHSNPVLDDINYYVIVTPIEEVSVRINAKKTEKFSTWFDRLN